MTYDNNFFPNGIEDLPPSGIDAVSRSRITGYTPTEPDVIDTGTEQLESPTVKDIVAQREDNPFLRLAVIGGVMGVICLFLWGIFAFLSPKAPTVVAEELEVEETVEAEPDYQAQLAFRDQFHSLEKKPEAQTNSTPTPALLVNNPISQGELGILNRRRTNTKVVPSASAIAIDRGITKGKIELPLVWDSSLASEQQQSNQITVILEEPIYDTEGKVIFDRGSVAIVEVQSINDANGLVTAYVSQIDDTTFNPGELILRNNKRSALVAKASKRSNFGNRLLVGGVDTLSSFGQQILIPETNSTVSNGSAIVTSQSRNSVGRDLAGSALDGFGSSLSNELEQRSDRNQIGDGGTIFTLAQNTTVYLTNIKPLKINPQP